MKIKVASALSIDRFTFKLADQLRSDLRSCLSSCVDPRIVEEAVTSLDSSVLKRYKTSNSSIDTAEIAVNKWLEVQQHIWHYNLSHSQEWHQTARYVVDAILGDFALDDIFESCRHSTGTTLGVKYADSASLVYKMMFPISGTASAVKLFNLYLDWDPHLRDLILKLNGCNSWPDNELAYDIVDASRLTTVPKNDKTDRVIAIEPTINMFLQQGMMELLYRKLRNFGLDVSLLPNQHAKLAEYASITGSESTIDFSSASDCVSVMGVRCLFPPKWVGCLEAMRTPGVLVREHRVSNQSFATMGNATTFPVESLYFYSIAVAAVHQRLRTSRFSRIPDWNLIKREVISVFGDDCILPTADAPSFITMCESMGCIVNHDKSFFSINGKFRESCGADFYNGANIRPVQYQAPRNAKPSNVQAWIHNIWNQTLKYAISACGPELYVYRFEPSLKVIKRFYQEQHFDVSHIVPDDFPDDAGFKYFEDPRLLIWMNKMVPVCKVDKHGSTKFTYLSSAIERRTFLRQIDIDGTGIYTKVDCLSEALYWSSLKTTHQQSVPYDCCDLFSALSYMTSVRSKVSSKSRYARKVDRGYVVSRTVFPRPFGKVVRNN